MTWNTRRAMLLGGGRTFAPADEGGSGGGEGEGGSGGGDGEGGDGTGDGEGDGGSDKGGSGSILDLAKPSGKPGDKDGEGDGEYKAPDYLPEHLRGKDDADTMRKVHEAYAGARKALAKGGQGDADVPEKSDGYEFKDTSEEGKPDKVFAELTSEASKPVVSLAQKAAHKIGLGGAKFNEFMREFVSGAAESGLPIGVDDGEAQEISAEAEMEKLTELVGSGSEASTLVNTVSTYAQKLVDRGTIAQEDLAEFSTMVGTAESAHLFYRIMTAELGEKPIPVAEGGSGTVTQTDAYALHAKASAMPEGAEKTQAMEEAQRAMQKAFGQNSTGSVKSSVL